MRNWPAIHRTFAAMIVVAALPIGLLWVPGGSTRAQGTPEERAKALEVLAIFDRLVEAKAAALREAEARVVLDRANQANYEKIRKLGIASEIGQMQVDYQVLESEALRARMRAELAEAKVRRQQAGRAVARRDQAGPSEDGILETIERHLDDLERDAGRLEARLERLEEKQTANRADIDSIIQTLKLKGIL